MTGFEFVPTRQQAESSNIFRFMREHGIRSLEELHERSVRDPCWFWESVERDVGIVWDAPYSKTLDVSRGIAWPRWFVGGRTNIYRSSVERVAAEDPGRTAYVFVSEDGRTSSLTYSELDARVSRLAGGLASAGIGRGDVVAIYMPMIEEAITAILAAAKIGAVQTVIFSGYGPDALSVRLKDCNARALFVTDGFYRKGRPVSHADAVARVEREWGGGDAARRIIVVRHGGVDDYSDRGGGASDSGGDGVGNGGNGNDGGPAVVYYDELVAAARPGARQTRAMDSEDPLFVMYTSGTTGMPKGTVHTHGGFSVFAGHQAAYLVDMKGDDVLFWPADIGWITGLVWNVYGLLLAGACAVIYDGSLDHPDMNRTWQILADHGVTIFGTSPTAVRMMRRAGAAPPPGLVPERLRNIPTTGEPMDRESWRWLFERVGRGRIPIMNLSGGTEIGGAMLSVLPGMSIRPSTVGRPVPGMDVDAVDDGGQPVRDNATGYLVVRAPWPAMTRGLLNNDAGYMETYWSRFDGAVWFHGDYVRVDGDGLWYMQGRTDDVINVSGHRMGTAEIEHAALLHAGISDAAAVAIPDEVTGEAIVLFFVEGGAGGGRNGGSGSADAPPHGSAAAGGGGGDGGSHRVGPIPESEVVGHVCERLGKIARPRHVFRLSDLPKTRTGKVMRRTLRSALLGQDLGDLSALENPGIMDEIPRLGRAARASE